MKETVIAKMNSMCEMRELAAKGGIVYFQIYFTVPEPRFYSEIGELQNHERVVEILADHIGALDHNFVEAKPGKPLFGAAINGAWQLEYTDNVAEVREVVRLARSFYVPDGTGVPFPRDCGAITIEGARDSSIPYGKKDRVE